MLQHIADKFLVKKRFAYYANHLSLSEDSLWKMVMDLTISRDLHTTSLGVEPETSGRLYTGKGVKITAFMAKNLFELANYILVHGLCSRNTGIQS